MTSLRRSDLQVSEGARGEGGRPAQHQEVQHQRRPPGGQDRRGGGGQLQLQPEAEPQHGLLQLQGLQPGLRDGHAGQGSRGLQVSQEIPVAVQGYIGLIAGTTCQSSLRTRWPGEP